MEGLLYPNPAERRSPNSALTTLIAIACTAFQFWWYSTAVGSTVPSVTHTPGVRVLEKSIKLPTVPVGKLQMAASVFVILISASVNVATKLDSLFLETTAGANDPNP
jgi:hypothetical protein